MTDIQTAFRIFKCDLSVIHFALNGLPVFWKVAPGSTAIDQEELGEIDMNRTCTRSVLVLGLLIGLSVNHVALSFSSRLNTRHDLGTPGDITSGTQVMTGQLRVYRPHGGTVIMEVGRTVAASSRLC